MVLDPEEKEYELIPVSPVRRLEKRIDQLESTSESPRTIFKDIIDIVKMNQMLVDEMAKSNDALRIELSKLPGRLDDLITNLKEMISFIKASGEAEAPGISKDTMKPVVDKLDEIVKTNKSLAEKNESMMDLLDEVGNKMRRPMVRPVGMTRVLRPKQMR